MFSIVDGVILEGLPVEDAHELVAVNRWISGLGLPVRVPKDRLCTPGRAERSDGPQSP